MDRPDIILAEFIWSGFNAMVIRLLGGTPYILDEHNVEFLRFERMQRGNRFSRYILKLYEKFACSFASKVFCVSENDKAFLGSQLNIPEYKLYVVPNGVDTEKFHLDHMGRKRTRAKLNITSEPLILFFGKLDYKPNYEAVQIILNRILPNVLYKLPEAKFLIVGDNPPTKYTHNSILYTGVVRTVEDYINASDIVICPLLSGGGTRIKILEALACGKVVISTHIGAEGLIDDECDNSLRIIDNWDDFSDEIIEALNDIADAKTQNTFILKYSWDKISETILI